MDFLSQYLPGGLDIGDIFPDTSSASTVPFALYSHIQFLADLGRALVPRD
jgi:hypothetical protein